MTRGTRVALLIGAGACAAACGVLAPQGSGDDNLPDARLGPFRPFAADEVTLPPLVALDFAATLGGPDAWMTPEGTFVLMVHSAPDGDPATVLRRMTGDTPTEFTGDEVVLAGEPDGLRDPAVVRDGDTTVVFFGVGTGDRIGVARAEADAPLVADPQPVLVAADPVASPIGAPSVVIVDGEWLLFFERGRGIALAVSADGIDFHDEGLVLGPGDGWDAATVGDPAAVVTHTPLGDRRVRLYYTGRSSASQESDVGVAVSFDGHTGFERFVGNPVVALDGDESAPTVVSGAGDETTYLFFERTSGTGRAAIGGAAIP